MALSRMLPSGTTEGIVNFTGFERVVTVDQVVITVIPILLSAVFFCNLVSHCNHSLSLLKM